MKFFSVFTVILIVSYVDITSAASNGFPNRKPTTPTTQPQSADCISTLVFRPGRFSHIREGPYRSQSRDIRQMPFAKVVEIFPWLYIAVQQSLLFEWSEHTLFFKCILEYFGTEYILELAEGMSRGDKRRVCGCNAMKTAKANKRGRVVVNDNEEAFCRGPPLDLVDRMAYCDAIRGKIRQYFPAHPQHWEHYLEELPAHLNSLLEGSQPLTPRMWSILLRDEASSAAVGNANTNNAAAAQIPTVSTASAAAHPDTGIHHFGPPQLPVHLDEPNVDVGAVEVASENEHPISQPTPQQTRFPVMDCPPELRFNILIKRDDPATENCVKGQILSSRAVLDVLRVTLAQAVRVFPWLPFRVQERLLFEWSADGQFFECIYKYFRSEYIFSIACRACHDWQTRIYGAINTLQKQGQVGGASGSAGTAYSQYNKEVSEVAAGIANAMQSHKTTLLNTLSMYFRRIFGHQLHWEVYITNLPAHLNGLVRGTFPLTVHMSWMIPRDEGCRAAAGVTNVNNAGTAQSTIGNANPTIGEVGETGYTPHFQIPTTSRASAAGQPWYDSSIAQIGPQITVHCAEPNVDGSTEVANENDYSMSQPTTPRTRVQLPGSHETVYTPPWTGLFDVRETGDTPHSQILPMSTGATGNPSAGTGVSGAIGDPSGKKTIPVRRLDGSIEEIQVDCPISPATSTVSTGAAGNPSADAGVNGAIGDPGDRITIYIQKSDGSIEERQVRRQKNRSIEEKKDRP